MGEFRHPRAAQAVTPGGQHDMPRQQMQGLYGGVDGQLNQSICSWRNPGDPVFVAHIQRQHFAIPAQVVGPLQSRNFVQPGPALCAELRFEPGTEGQRGQAERRSGQVLGRAQRLHTGGGCPRPFKTGRGLIENHCINTEMA